MLQVRLLPDALYSLALLLAGGQQDVALLKDFFDGWDGEDVNLIAWLAARGPL